MNKIAVSVLNQATAGRPDTPLTLGVTGPITHRTTLGVRDALREIGGSASRRWPTVHLDLTCCTEVDVDGMLALKVSQEEARRHGGDLRLVAVPPLVARQLRQHNFDGLLLRQQGDPDEE